MMLRTLTSNDINQVLTLCNTIFPDDLGEIKTELQCSLKKSLNFSKYFVLTEKSQIIGLIGVNAFAPISQIFWLGWFFVDEKFRGQGYGKILLNYAIQYAKKEKAESLCAWTTTCEVKKYGSNKFYLSQDWQEVSCPLVFFKGQPVLVFGLSFNKNTSITLPHHLQWLK